MIHLLPIARSWFKPRGICMTAAALMMAPQLLAAPIAVETPIHKPRGLALDDSGSSAGVHEPARGDRSIIAVAAVRDAMRLAALLEVNGLNLGLVEERGAAGRCRLGEKILEPAPVDLVARRGEELAGANLGAVGERTGAVVEEEAEAELRQLIVDQVFLQTELLSEVMRPDLNGRLADFVGTLGNGETPLLENQHPRFRKLSEKLLGECQAR